MLNKSKELGSTEAITMQFDSEQSHVDGRINTQGS